MAIRVRVSCINKLDRDNPHERILFIGGVNHDGTRWKLSQKEAIKSIEDGQYVFYVQVDTYITDVIVSTHNGNKYLKTKPDAIGRDNLLRLPECP